MSNNGNHELENRHPEEQASAEAFSGRLRIFSSLSIPSFRMFLVGMFGQMAAMNMQQITTPLLVYRVTGSASAIGIMAVSGTVPHIFSALYGGVIADRLEKKYVLML